MSVAWAKRDKALPARLKAAPSVVYVFLRAAFATGGEVMQTPIWHAAVAMKTLERELIPLVMSIWTVEVTGDASAPTP